MTLRLCFAGTPAFAADILSSLLAYPQYEWVGVYTQPDKPRGRGQQIQISPVKAVAEQHHIPVFQANSLKNTKALATFQALKPDLFIVVAYGLIIPKSFLDSPRHGCINVHASLLPRFRGAAPIQRAIEAGDLETGITLMQMDEGLDTGDMLLKRACSIEPLDTTASLSAKLLDLAKPALYELLNKIDQGQALLPEKQDERFASYAPKLQKSEATLDFTLPAEQLERKIRAFNPWPVASHQFSENSPVIRIFKASVAEEAHKEAPGTVLNLSKDGLVVAAGQGSALRITELQLPGKKPQSIAHLWQHPSLQKQVKNSA